MTNAVVKIEEGATLSSPERRRLSDLEATIERDLGTFVEVGKALAEIRDARPRLYRATHATFEAYCRERWGMDRTYAHRVMAGAEVAGRLLPIGNKPASESQVRPLLRLEPAQQPAAWERAIELAAADFDQGAGPERVSRPTARHVEAAVREIIQPTPGTRDRPETEKPLSRRQTVEGLSDAIRSLKAIRPGLPEKARTIVGGIITNLTRIRELTEQGKDI